MIRRALFLSLLLGVPSAALRAAAPPVLLGEELLVFAAASLADVLGELGERFAAAGGLRPAFSYSGSSTLARQIEEGAPADLFVSADAEKVAHLARRKLVFEETRRELLANRLVVVVNATGGPALASGRDLATPKVRTLALAQPETVPAGIYAREYLKRAGLWSQVKAKIVPTESVRAALAAVESGNADAAFVYSTDAAISKRVRIALEIPPSELPRIVYVAAVPVAARHADEARRFLDFLSSPEAAVVFRRYGFIAPPPPAP